MKIIVRYCAPMGHMSTRAIEVDENSDGTVLQQEIEKSFGIPPENQIIKIKNSGQIDPLSDYGVKEKSIIFLESAEISKESTKAELPMGQTGHYFAKLGILNTIFEEESKSPKTSLSNDSGSDNEEQFPSPLISKNNELEDFLKLCKQGDEEKIAEFLKKSGEEEEYKLSGPNETKEEIKSPDPTAKRNKISSLVNDNGTGGWNAVHYSIYFGYNGVFKILLANNADLDRMSNDEWTPLQLAVYKENLEILDPILKSKTVQVNRLTSRGSALHIAAKRGNVNVVKALLEAGADITLKNEDGAIPLDIVVNDEVRKLLEQAEAKKIEIERSKIFVPPRPPKISGWVLQTGNFIFNMKKRFYALDPDQGTLTSYKRETDYPKKHRKIVPLKEVIKVQRVNEGFFLSKKYYYFEVWYPKRAILATYSEDLVIKWVTYIYQATIYCRFLEQTANEDLKGEASDQRTQTLAILEKERETPNQVVRLGEKDFPPAETTTRPRRLTNGKMKPLSPSLIPETPKKKVVNFKSFEVLQMLGKGSFGSVYKVMKKDTGKIYAMKVLNKKKLITYNQLKYAVTEANILKRANHPFILKLHYAFQTPEFLYMVIDYCSGGDLGLLLAKKEIFSSEATKFYMAELLLAIEELHKMDAIYRDLKPENILIAEDGHIKLADFGLAKEHVDDNKIAKSFCGTPAYLSPEMVFHRGAGKSADIYGYGIVMYEMLCGFPPYYTEDINKLYARIKRGDLKIPSTLKETERHLIKGLLERQPELRLGVDDKDEIKKHPFFDGIDWEKLKRKEITPPYLEEIQKQDEEQLMVENQPLLLDEDYVESNKTRNRVKNFTFIRELLEENGSHNEKDVTIASQQTTKIDLTAQ